VIAAHDEAHNNTVALKDLLLASSATDFKALAVNARAQT
jgi:hypothetical protein